MTFAQRGAGTVAGIDGLSHDGITCYACNNIGHYASDCPEEPRNTDEEQP
jgi:predicted HD phosphohydrolase